MEELVYDLQTAGINVDLLVGLDDKATMRYGVRLRPFGKGLHRDQMVMADGKTFAAAVENAVNAARKGGWQPLDWSARPWRTATRVGSGGAYGLT